MGKWEGKTEITINRNPYFGVYEIKGICAEGTLMLKRSDVARIFGSQLCEPGDSFRGTLHLTIETEELTGAKP